MKTFNTRVWLSAEDHVLLSALSERLSHARHATFQQLFIRQEPLTEVKRALMNRFGLSSRQFNAVRYDAQQAVATWSGTLNHRLEALADRIRATDEARGKIERSLKTTLVTLPVAQRPPELIQTLMRAGLLPATALQAWHTARAAQSAEVVSAQSPSKARRPTSKTGRAANARVSPTQRHATLQALWKGLRRRTMLSERLTRLTAQQEQLKAERVGPPRVCFGGRRALAQATRAHHQAHWRLTHDTLTPPQRHRLEQDLKNARGQFRS